MYSCSHHKKLMRVLPIAHLQKRSAARVTLKSCAADLLIDEGRLRRASGMGAAAEDGRSQGPGRGRTRVPRNATAEPGLRYF